MKRTTALRQPAFPDHWFSAKAFLATLAGLTLGAAAFAQTKWDLPTAYPATNYHTENITQFAKDVDAATAGKVKI
ncbi:hypothetical protein ACSFA7_32060, partial [Variovorax sp. LT1R20]